MFCAVRQYGFPLHVHHWHALISWGSKIVDWCQKHPTEDVFVHVDSGLALQPNLEWGFVCAGSWPLRKFIDVVKPYVDVKFIDWEPHDMSVLVCSIVIICFSQ